MKLHMIKTFLEAIEKQNSGNQIILLTAAGTITGKLHHPSDMGGSARLTPATLIGSIAKVADEVAQNTNIPTSDFITLDAVRIVQHGQNICFPQLVVFTDDVIGISVGDPNTW